MLSEVSQIQFTLNEIGAAPELDLAADNRRASRNLIYRVGEKAFPRLSRCRQSGGCKREGGRIAGDARHMTSFVFINSCQPSGGLTSDVVRSPSKLTSLLAGALTHTTSCLCPDNVSARFWWEIERHINRTHSHAHARFEARNFFRALQEKVRLSVLQSESGARGNQSNHCGRSLLCTCKWCCLLVDAKAQPGEVFGDNELGFLQKECHKTLENCLF